jgi:hypothetical protein
MAEKTVKASRKLRKERKNRSKKVCHTTRKSRPQLMTRSVEQQSPRLPSPPRRSNRLEKSWLYELDLDVDSIFGVSPFSPVSRGWGYRFFIMYYRWITFALRSRGIEMGMTDLRGNIRRNRANGGQISF